MAGRCLRKEGPKMPADYDEIVSRLNKIEFLLSQLGGALTSTGDVSLLNGTVSMQRTRRGWRTSFQPTEGF